MLDILVIGGKKCASTSLVDYLKLSKKVNYCIFKSSSVLTKQNLTKQDFENYSQFFPNQPGMKAEGSPANSDLVHVDNVIKNLKFIGANPKILLIVRNPIKRIESHYLNDLKSGRIKNLENADKFIFGPFKALTNGFFGIILKKYIEEFGQENILVLKFDELIKQESTELKKVKEFLNLEDELPLTLPKSNKSDGAYTKNKVGTFYRKHIAFFYKKTGLPSLSFLNSFLKGAFSKKIYASEGIKLNQEQINTLKLIYQADNAMFESICGFSYWDLER